VVLLKIDKKLGWAEKPNLNTGNHMPKVDSTPALAILVTLTPHTDNNPCALLLLDNFLEWSRRGQP